jgi:tetratricopeptide (TPR) repeat protein
MKHTLVMMPLAISMALSGCANPINMYTAQRYFDAGTAAEQAGNYQLAHENYYRAYVNTEIGHADGQRKALAMYNLARMKGYLCMKAEAEPLLLNSMAVEEKALSQNGSWYTGRLVETARFYLGFGEYAKAVPYFEKATLRLVNSGNEQTIPIEMADLWDDYAETLRWTGSESKANDVANRARSLRNSNTGKTARFAPFLYGKNCKTEG